MADIITLIVGPIALYLVSLIVGIVAPSLLGLFDAVAPHLLDPIGRELDYLFHYRSNIEKLSEEVDELQKVSETIKAAWTNAGEIELNVQEWLTCVDGIIKNALKFLEDEKKENEGFFNRLCAWLNLKSWYQKSKKAKQTAAEIVPKIQERKQFSSPPPPKIKIPAVEGYEAFKSRMPILTKIIKSLSNANVNLIGVYGMGGTGKTTLVNEIARKCEEDKLLDEVVIATVSQSPKIIEIQGEISDKLNLKLEKESESGRAGQLCEELKKLLNKKKSILVILDDIWEKLDLVKVGIPFGDSYKGCKIMMTSRNQHLLSTEMGTQQDFSIEVLPKKEAWDLFKKTAGDLIEAPELKPIATEIVEECAGLPLAVKAVANALKNKDSSIWRDALVQLKSSGATNIVGIDPKLYSSLKLSYDFLESNEVRSLFLLCCLLPEDYNISIQDFLKYGKGLGLFQGTLKKSRDRAHALVAHLKGSCLLLDGNTTESVRVHDVVRDVGISIASKDKNMLIVRNEDRLEECATEERLRNCSAISLPYSTIQELPKELECPELKFLLLLSKDHSLAISDNFFEGMKQLKVLNLTNIHFSSLPSSLHLLSNLQTLCLDKCRLRDIARIGELTKLEVLSFASSNIEELPREIGQLTHLRMLDLRNCSKLKVIPPNVIAGFSRLEDLHMEESFVGWGVNGNASLSELEHLSSLVTLDIHIRDAMILPKDLRFEKLLRYRIFIGDGWDWSGEYKTTRTLKLKPITRIQQEFGIQSLLKGAEDLYLEELKDIRGVLHELDGEGFPQLKHLHIQKGCEIEYVFYTTEWLPNKAFPNLESLFLSNLIKLKEICQGQIPPECFSKLKSVNVASCGGLKNLFSISIARRLSQLQELEIYECKSMDEIVDEGREGSEGNNEAMDKIIFPQLRTLRLQSLPKLTTFYSKGTTRPSLNYTPTIDAGSGEIISEGEHDIPIPLFNEKVAFPNLEGLVIENVNSLKEIWPSQLPVDDGSFCNLKWFRVRGCEHLLSINIIPSNMLMRLQNMERLTVYECGGSLEYIFDLGGLHDKERHVELRDLHLWNLPGLKQIWKKDPQTNFVCQKLSSLTVFGCGNLRSIFATSMVKSLKQLQQLSITNCEMVEEIVEEEGVQEQATDKIVFPQLTSLTLRDLPQLKSFCQGSHILEWPSSKKLDVSGSDNMETFALESSNFEEMRGKDHLGTPTKQPLFLVDKVAFPNLENLDIKTVKSLKEIWPSQLSVDDHSFCKLKSLYILWFEHLLNIVPSNMLIKLRNLESLEVWGNDSVEYIFDVGELNDMERHVLRSIPLRKLIVGCYRKLKQIWKMDPQLSGYFPFQNLTSLRVSSCDNLRHIFTTSIAKSLVQLQALDICYSGNVEEIVGNEGVEEESMGKIVFPGLTSLILNNLPQLKTFYQGILKVETFSSESSSFEESRGKGHVGTPTKPLFLVDKVVFPNLEELKLWSMSSMKEIWQDQYYATSFGKLRVLEVCNCESLTHVLTLAIAKSIVHIKSIIIDNCKMMKEVIASEEGEKTNETIFSQLNSLKLRNLQNLTSFCARSNTFSFPSLEQVLVEKCPELKTFSDGILHTPKLHKVLVQSEEKSDKGFWKGDLNSTIQYLSEQKIEFLRLSELSELKQICHDQFPFEACYVKYLMVEKCTSLLNVVSSNMLESLQNLEKITVEICDSLEQVFGLEGLDYNEIHYGQYRHLEEINLTQLPKLRYLWNKDPKGILSFRSLRWLNIHKCNNLRNLFSPSMIPDLYGLKGLKITDCLNMKEIVEKEKEAKKEAIDEIAIHCSSIILEGLPNLTSFYPGNHTLAFRNLGTLKIAGCPRIKTFTSTNEGLQETSGDGNLDVPSVALFINNKVECIGLEELELEDLNSIKEIWQGQFHAWSFRGLKTLTVRSCQSLTHLLPFEIAKSLVYIKSIIVDGCEMMKEIITSEEGDEAITSEEGDEAITSDEGDEADYETTFSQLSSLKLRSLPNLTNFCIRSNTFSFRSLEQVLVEECPKLKNFSNGNLNTPKLEKVHIQEHEWVWKGDLNTTIQHLFSQKGDHL